MSSFLELFSIVLGALSLSLFVFGLALTFFELTPFNTSILAFGGGLIGLFIAAILWLLSPQLAKYFGIEKNNNRKRHFSTKVPKLFEENVEKNSNFTELLTRIRGCFALIQVIFKKYIIIFKAIHYSLETTIMSEMGESTLNASVIHTAPGC